MSQIKSRLKTAYENVEFQASNTWVHSSQAYQKANQALYVRENKVKDALADEPTRPRTVHDSIPQSRLAEYSNYEYNESRELCYASSATNVSFYYPCICKRSCIKEPWMIPEIEQMFIWFSYAPNFDILEILRTEELGHLDEEEQGKFGRSSACRWHDFHEISPVFYNTLERTPGKSRYTSCAPVPETDLNKFIPSQLNIQTFEDMILRMKIKADKVRYLWSEHSAPKSESLNDKNMNILKSPLGNYFVLDNNDNTEQQKQQQNQRLLKKTRTQYDHKLKTNDFGQLQNLAESIRTLEILIFNSARQAATSSFSRNDYDSYETTDAMPKTEIEIVPARRLYSAVLQGLSTDKKQSSSTDVTSPSASSAIEKSSLSMSSISPTKTTTSSCFSTENSSVAVLTPAQKSSQVLSKNETQTLNPPSQWISQASYWGAANSPGKNNGQTSQEQIKTPQLNFSPLKPSGQKETANVSFKLTNSSSSNTTITTSYSDTYAGNTVNTGLNVSSSPANITNAPSYSSSTAYLGNTYGSNNTTCFNNAYSNNNYFNNSYHFNSQYTTNFQNNTYAGASYSNNFYANNTYQSNQVSSINSRGVLPQFNRQAYPSTQQAHMSTPHSMWFVQHNRPSAVCSVAHFATQPYFFLPSPAPPPPPPQPTLPPRQNQRWSPSPHYVRTSSTVPSYHMPLTTQHTSSTFPPQHWGNQNQTLYRANSNQQISSASQEFLDGLSGQPLRIKPKSKKDANFPQHNTARTRSPSEHLDNAEVSSSAYSNASMTYSQRSSGSSDRFSLPSLEKPLLVKAAASTSSLEFRRLKVYNHLNDGGQCSVQKRASEVVLGSQNSNFFSSDSEESHTLLPLSVSVSEELERQALEQYQYSDENFYQELERQAEEQYDEDRSENWICPPNENPLFGGHTILGILEPTKNYLFFIFVVYVDMNIYYAYLC